MDVRWGSPNFGQWVGVELDDVHHRQLWIPPGFAHGFCVLSDEAEFVYKCTSYYDPASDTGVRWNDPTIGVTWPLQEADLQLSTKDQSLPLLSEKPVATLPSYEVNT
ncbi:hypothetical protein GCM10009097_59200 [Pigmentiphaga daeguensis]|uniref:dTDP-4-dehydrorhamnose 3,5-epimerase n=1 Tax=Pigmentiphaga daeguensis TaxID=414049 RepID=A0ABP3N2U4_9BURK